MTYWKNLKKGAWRPDPTVDNFRSPTPRGLHPHAFDAGEEVRNPQRMYEYRNGFAPKQHLRPPHSIMHPHPYPPHLGQAPAAPPNFFSFVADHPFLTFGLGALVFYGLAKLKEKDGGSRINPSYPLISNPTTILSPGESQLVSAENCEPIPARRALVPFQPALPLVQKPSPSPGEVEIKAKVVEQEDVLVKPRTPKPVESEKQKRCYKGRKTTQARDESGKFLSSGTRKRAVWEGRRK